MRWLNRSLGNKVLGLACVIAALALSGILLITALWQRRSTLREIDRMGHQVAGLLEVAMDDPMVRGDGEVLASLFRRSGELNPDITVHLADAEGRIRYSTRPDLLKIKVQEAHPSPEVQRFVPEALRHPLETGSMTELQGRPTFLRVKTLPNEPRCQGCHGDQRRILGAMVLLKDASAEWSAAGDRNRLIAWLSLASLMTIALGLGILVARAITRPLADFGRVLGAVAAGDLRTEARIGSQDEVGAMGRALNEAILRLRESFQEIQESALTIAQASSEIAAGNQDLSVRTEEQAASLEETASAMEEFTATVRQSVENARQAAEAATHAEASAGDGQASVARLVASMAAINAASARINEIIGVVDEIAFQTNLLALNAAVEAARAGEQGRGFAVVATEVRNLARRSAEAAKEIKGLIRDSVTKAQEGQKVATHTGDIIRQSVDEVRRVREVIGDIATAAHEQATGIQEINRAVLQMDQVTQQNAALVEEAAAAAESLDDQTQSLRSILARFRTHD